jgi:cation:H+ antiporter
VTIAINLSLFIVSCAILLASGSFFIEALTKIASFLKMSKFVVSFVIVGIATSLPEFFVGISSALAKQTSISLGNVIGSNIANLTIILGLSVILARGIKIESKTTKKDALYMLLIAILPLILMLIGRSLSRLDGFILIIIFITYCTWLIRQRKSFQKQESGNVGRLEIVLHAFLFIISAILLQVSAKYTVKYASLLSIDLHLPQIFIGLFIIALGTSLPELVVGFQAVKKKEEEVVLGNIMGSVVANSTLVLGITALITPITANILIFLTSISFMILAAFLFTTFTESGDKIYVKEGIAMIVVYIIFIIIQFYIQNISGVAVA